MPDLLTPKDIGLKITIAMMLPTDIQIIMQAEHMLKTGWCLLPVSRSCYTCALAMLGHK